MLGAEDLFGPVSGQVFGHVDELAAAVVAMARIALGVFIGQHAADGLHHGRAGVVFRGDHLQAAPLPVDLAGDGGPKFRVLSFDAVHGRCPAVEKRSARRKARPRQAAIVGRSGQFVNAEGSPIDGWLVNR